MRTVIAGFIAGSVSVLVFHQFGFFIANELGLLKVQLYNMRPVPPLGVPTIVSPAFWGGLWGIVGAFIVPRLPGGRGRSCWAGSCSPASSSRSSTGSSCCRSRAQPIGGGFRMPGVVVVPLVYAFWGFGMWLIFGLTRRALGGAKWNG